MAESNSRKFFTYFVFAILALVMVFITIIAVFWFWPSDLNLFRFGNVHAVNSYTRFFGDDIDEMLGSRNLIIQTDHTDVEISVRNPGQLSEQSITLFEDARGISFNQMHRSHIDWSQIVLDDGSVFYKIRVHEPVGAVTRSARLIINLLSDTPDNVVPYNFIFMTGTGNVSLTADPNAQHMRVDSIRIPRGTFGAFNFSPPPNAHGMSLDIERIYVESNVRTLSATAHSHIYIASPSGRFTLGTVGNVTVRDGVSVNVRATTVVGDIYFNSVAGSLHVGTATGDVSVNTTVANVNFTTLNGDIDITHNGTASVSIRTLNGDIYFNSTFGGTLSVPALHGNITARATHTTMNIGGNGIGVNGVRGNVDIENNFANTTVTFNNTIDVMAMIAQLPTTRILTQNGIITAHNIAGPITALVRTGGTGRINATFRGISTGLNFLGYGSFLDNGTFHVGDSLSTTTHGNIHVRLLPTGSGVNARFMSSNIAVDDTRVALDRANWGSNSPLSTGGVHIPNTSAQYHNGLPHDGAPWRVFGGEPTRTLNIRTSNQLILTR